ncbi:MAG: hypothetical protein RLZZ531_1169 [Bacteroidota bacterium]|jgi:hypothetical protein
MEDNLKDLLKNKLSFSDLTASERAQLLEWCVDDEEFQSLKKLFHQVDAWSEHQTEETNTKLRLDQLFAIQYAGKQTPSNGRDIRFSKNRFSRMSSWITVSAVAAALVVTWLVYPPAENNMTAKKNSPEKPLEKTKKEDKQMEIIESKQQVELAYQAPTVQNQRQMVLESIAVDSIVQNAQLATTLAPVSLTMDASSMLANGSSFTLSTAGAATSYAWTNDNLSTVQIVGEQNFKMKKNTSGRKKQADAFTSFSVKSMPEMLDVIVSAY